MRSARVARPQSPSVGTASAPETVSVPLAAAWLGAVSFVVTPPAPMVLTAVTEAKLVTETETAQLPFAGMVPPERVSEPPSAVAVAVPPQVFVRPGVAALTRPEG